MRFPKHILWAIIFCTLIVQPLCGQTTNVDGTTHFLEVITDTQILNGKKFWLANEPDEGKYVWSDDHKSSTYSPAKQTIYFVTDWDEKKAWVKVDGKLYELPLVSAKKVPKDFSKAKEGDRFMRVFSAKDITAAVEYVIESIGRADDCIRTAYNVNLIVSQGTRKETRSVRNVWGC